MTGLAKRIRSSPIVRDKQLPRLIDELLNVVKGALLVPRGWPTGCQTSNAWVQSGGRMKDRGTTKTNRCVSVLTRFFAIYATAAMRAALVACGQTLKT